MPYVNQKMLATFFVMADGLSNSKRERCRQGLVIQNG
jgi:hypothetical protein